MAKGLQNRIQIGLVVELGYPNAGWQSAELGLRKRNSELSPPSTWICIRGRTPPAAPPAGGKSSPAAAASDSTGPGQEPGEGELEALSPGEGGEAVRGAPVERVLALGDPLVLSRSSATTNS